MSKAKTMGACKLWLLTCSLVVVSIGQSSVALAQDESPRPTPSTCTYSTYQWSVEEKRAVNREQVSKEYSAVTDDERDPKEPRCTVCREDQVELKVGELESVWVCWVYAEALEKALRTIVDSGEFELEELEGYRVGRTRGKVVDGLRTEWSNHSFGTALDVNASSNGLYGNCDVDVLSEDSIEQCKLRMGGKWRPKKQPRVSIVKDGVVYKALTEFWKWGGEIDGELKDIMHFSITGY
ncbi:MAG: M15 family metallopeptidase [Myxococcota bacterium]|jgi:hypothetical protein|nr:M15 family metallopeptidase [Myxococcota bacterium]